jgi:hypothetical protein
MIHFMPAIKDRYLYLLFIVCIILFFSGCAGPKVAMDLLGDTRQNPEPLVNNEASIFVEIDPSINNYERIDETLKQSLEIALKNSNIFGTDASQLYRIKANILVASQSPMSFGNFNGKLEVNYAVFDETKNEIINETIYTEAGSDKFYFVGAKRHRRARAVNISKNVLQFVEILQNKLRQ